MRSFRHWTPRYVYNRLRLLAFERSYPDAPWLTPAMVNILEGWLKPTDRGFEWGSGRSTLWFARRVAHLVSMEHDRNWGQQVADNLAGAGLVDRVDHRTELVDHEEDGDIPYVNAIREIPDASLDFCIIDGVCRDHCAVLAPPKIKPGGILIVDNINWYLPREPKFHGPGSRGVEEGCASKLWSSFGETISSWRCCWTTSGVTDTAFWIRPVAVDERAVQQQGKTEKVTA